ncbi:MAG: hypothetical protein KUA37_06250 [Desulfomicrobium sp.]|uniref:hypothetical protein n=1 Tax=Hoeflea sp. TaxID=1940281 RepID=UPI0025BD2E0B|nr:hypothetical protein [Hoeflea sp.]MBV1711593.1 hypothetical protein [Desulfomicrobium sp.]
MPNAPRKPYGRFPLKAAIGLALMAGAPAIYIVAQLSAGDWRIALAVTLSLLLCGLSGLLLVKAWQWWRQGGQSRGPTGTISMPRAARSAPAEPSAKRIVSGSAPAGFDAASFLASAQSKNPEPDKAPARRLLEDNRLRKLEDLRDHPTTSAPERDAAETSIKRIKRQRRQFPKRTTS